VSPANAAVVVDIKPIRAAAASTYFHFESWEKILHIIIIAVGSTGDVHPLLGLGRTFARHGHRVSFCTSPAFAEAVQRCGFRFLPFGTAEEYYAAINNPALWNPRTSLKALWKAVVVRIRPLFDLLNAEADNDTIMAAHPWAFGARLLQEKRGVPLVSLQISPSTFLSAKMPPIHKKFTIPMSLPYPLRAGLLWAFDRGVLDRICAPDINRLRSDLGLPPVKHIMGRWMHSPQGVLGLFPDWFAPPQTDWPREVTLTGFPLFDEAEFRSLDAELEDFLAKGPAPVVFTPGSTRVDGLSYYTAAAAALNTLGCRGIFLASQGTTLPGLTPNILTRSYVPLSILLPRTRALVHHGGIGTASQAFAAGIPQLITPFAHDQFDNAARVARLGCGFQMDSHRSSKAMLESLRQLLEDERIQRNCAAFRLRVGSGESACMKALSAIETVATGALSKNRTERAFARQQSAAAS
jgi:rhamnosyltransferase subunit B